MCPLSLALGTAIVITLYFLANVAYLVTLPLARIQSAPDDRVATAVLQAIFGSARRSHHGRRHHDFHLRLRQRPDPGRRARLLRDGSRRPVLPLHRPAERPARVPSQGLGPARASGRRCWCWREPAWWIRPTGAVTYGNLYSDLLDYVVFAVLIFYVLTIFGLFVLRRKRPDAERPYRAFGYPVIPAMYIVAALAIMVSAPV